MHKPVKDTPEMRMYGALGILIVGVFVGITGLAMMTGYRHNSIPKDEYLRRMQELDKPQYNHFKGRVPHYDSND
jgi:hypothetical protein